MVFISQWEINPPPPVCVCRPDLLTEQVKQEMPSNSVCDSGLRLETSDYISQHALQVSLSLSFLLLT